MQIITVFLLTSPYKKSTSSSGVAKRVEVAAAGVVAAADLVAGVVEAADLVAGLVEAEH